MRSAFSAPAFLLLFTAVAIARTAQPVATTCADFTRNIRMSEGSGNYGTNTGNGYWGAYQMGWQALVDAGYMSNSTTWTGKDGVNSLEDFLANPQAQDNAFLAYGNRNLGYLGNWQQYIGQTIGGVTVTRAGLIAGSHLVGAGGMKYWLTSGGDCTNKRSSSDAVDGNGTCAGTYVAENQVNQNCTGEETAGGGGGSCLAEHPVSSPVVYSEYGAWNRSGVSGGNNGWHRGADIYPEAAQGGASRGQPLKAANPGKVTIGSMGPQVKDGQFWTKYLHAGARQELQNQTVSAGDQIGVISDIGAAGAPHLHFEVLVPKGRVSASKCVIGDDTNDCAFPEGAGKRNANGFATSSSLASAAPSTWYYVNPERYLKSRVPVIGNARTRTGRSQSLPNSCSPGNQPEEQPSSAGESDNVNSYASGDGNYLVGEGAGINNADKELRSVLIDMTRQQALEVRAAASTAATVQDRMDSALAHLILLYGRGTH